MEKTEVDLTGRRLYNQAFGLAVFTVLYNMAEGFLSMLFGYEDENLTLFGFGGDSFIEVISGAGIAVMILRIRANKGQTRSSFERSALRITGVAFYLLTALLIFSGVVSAVKGHVPADTDWGMLISLVSIAVMWFTIIWKTRLGNKLGSDAITADAECARVCIYMSLILLLSSVVYKWTGFAYTDTLGTLGLAWFSFREGKECFEKASGDKLCGCDHD